MRYIPSGVLMQIGILAGCLTAQLVLTFIKHMHKKK